MFTTVSTATADCAREPSALRLGGEKMSRRMRYMIRLPFFLFRVLVWVLACVTGFEIWKSLRQFARRMWS